MHVLLEGSFQTEKLKEMGTSVRAPTEVDPEMSIQG